MLRYCRLACKRRLMCFHRGGTHMRFASTVRIATLAGVLASSQIAMAAEAPTYTKDIAPIMFRSCVNCHRPGEIAPMSLLNYETVRPWAMAVHARSEHDRCD